MIRTKKVFYLATCLILALMMFEWKTAFTSASGPGGGYSGAPGESNCVSCHTGKSLQTGTSVIVMTANDSTNLTYTPDSIYTIKITATISGISKWGFETCPLKDSTNTAIGTLSLISSATDVQLGSTSVSGKVRSYAYHTSSGNTGSGGRTWTFKWKAPHTNVGTITFYTVVNAADGNGFDTGDEIYSTPFTFKFRKTKAPEAGFTYTPTTPCTGDSISFKDTSTKSPTAWSWTFPGGKPSSSNLQNPKVFFGNGVYNVSLVATNQFGNSAKATVAVTVTKKPADTLFRIGSNPLCQGDSLTLVADYGGTAYKWSTGETTQVMHVHNAGTYFCTVSNGGCTTISQKVSVTIIPKPNISLTRLTGANSICQGDTSKFSLTTNGKTFSYFDNGNLLADSTGQKLALSNLTGTNLIYAIGYDSVGCPSDTSIKYKINVIAKPTISLLRTQGKDSICAGDTLKFKATSSVKTFSIFANGKFISSSTSAISISNLSDTINNKLYAIAYNSLGCPSDTSLIYNENVAPRLLAPILSAGKSTTQSVTIKWAAVNRAKGYEVSRDNGKTWKAPTGNLMDSEVNLASNFYIKLLVRAANVSACGHAPSGSILVSTLPCSQTTFNIHVDSSICLNSTARIIFSNISARHYSIIFDSIASKDSSFTFKPLRDTVIHFAMYDSLKSVCGAFDIDIPIKVTSVPPINIHSNKSFYCGNETAIINVDTGYSNYYVFRNGKGILSNNIGNYADSTFKNGDRIVEIGQINGCPSDSSNAIILHKYIPPVAGYRYNIASGRKVIFNDTSKAELSRTWYFGDYVTDTSLNPEHTYSANYAFTTSLVAVGKGGCKDSASKIISVSGIEQAVDPESLAIFPNPFNNLIKISLYVKKSLYLHVSIVDESGKIVAGIDNMHTVKGNNEITIPVEGLKPGSYILNIDGAGQNISRRIIKI